MIQQSYTLTLDTKVRRVQHSTLEHLHISRVQASRKSLDNRRWTNLLARQLRRNPLFALGDENPFLCTRSKALSPTEGDCVDQLEDSGAQSTRHQELQDVSMPPRSLPAWMEEPILAGEAGPELPETMADG